MKLKLALLFLLFGPVFFLQAQSKQEKLAGYFSALVKNRQFNGNVLIVENGKTIYENSFGYADFSSRKLNTKNTVFPIASISKTITATAILQLSQAGKLQVSAPVIQYLPEFPYPSITIKHLLSHSSGLPPYNAFFDSLRKQDPRRVYTNADFINGLIVNKKPLIYQPGEDGNYDNINFIVLALVLEKVSGMNYTAYVQKYILEPAGMTHTSFLPLTQQYAQNKKENFAFPHLYPHLYSDSMIRADQVPYIVQYWSAYNFTGFGDYVSTTHDLLKYDEAYYNGSLLNERSLQEAFSAVKLNNGKNNPGKFGLGWELEEDTTLGIIPYHSGAATGHSCVLLRNISKHQTVIVFDNTHFNAHEIGYNALKLLNGLEPPYPGKNLAKIYARVLLNQGADVARDSLYILKKDSVNYWLSEEEMNLLGYDFLGGSNNPNPFHFPEVHKYPEAIETFKLNVELFPDSWNAYDSYGEALLTVGRKDEAIRMYKRSIELNPKNEGGKMQLEKLLN